ncbi:hypothetical protein [Cytobacillus pseudoceanisediminis]|uniref:hypothetical protein n=1 Tax=Cytobacillus pseudoceanisediminis TaxID=3051614 RepID=UPI003C2B296D
MGWLGDLNCNRKPPMFFIGGFFTVAIGGFATCTGNSANRISSFANRKQKSAHRLKYFANRPAAAEIGSIFFLINIVNITNL